MSRHRLVILALLTLGAHAAISAPAADAAWLISGAGPSAGRAATMPRGSMPAVVPSGLIGSRTFTLTWTTSTLAGRPATGYVITRRSTLLGDSLVEGGTCKGATANGTPNVMTPANPAAPTQSCTDVTLVDVGTVSYSVTPVYLRWSGTASTMSTPTA